MTPQEETIVSVTEDADLIIGVDTHLDTHTAAICDARGRAVSQLQVAATTAGYEQLLAWVRSAAKATPTGSPPMPRYRQILHRLWIAAGNEALAYTQATGQPVRADKTWANLYDLRNHLAHSRLPDIDEGVVRRFTWGRLDFLHATTQHHLQIRA
jgi:hypothetical protein